MFLHQGKVGQILLGMDIRKERREQRRRDLVRKSKYIYRVINATSEHLFTALHL